MFITLKINDSIALLVAATAMANRNPPLIIAPGFLLERG
jgi:hypothetical protein